MPQNSHKSFTTAACLSLLLLTFYLVCESPDQSSALSRNLRRVPSQNGVKWPRLTLKEGKLIRQLNTIWDGWQRKTQKILSHNPRESTVAGSIVQVEQAKKFSERQIISKPGTGTANLQQPLSECYKIRRGRLSNGFHYTILPNSIPPGRVEAHLEMHVGSVEEADDEQGVAHLVEHVTFLGSRARANLYGTGTESNAYTDFHHTVYHMNCPSETDSQSPSSEGDMLPHALHALREIAFEAKMDNKRIDKERLAILSEISMMSTLEYRITTKEMEELHKETILPSRFPIGKEDVIATVPLEKVRRFYDRFYHPNRADLFVVGDINPDHAEAQIRRIFRGVPRNRSQSGLVQNVGGIVVEGLENLGRSIETVGTDESTLFSSKSLHHANLQRLQAQQLNLSDIFHNVRLRKPLRTKSPVVTAAEGLAREVELSERKSWGVRPRMKHKWSSDRNTSVEPVVFTHDLLSSFHLIMCAKRPVSRLSTVMDLRDYISTRLAVSGIVHRMNSRCKANIPYSGVEFDHSDSASEGCCVTTIKIFCEAQQWESQLERSLGEIRDVYRNGLSPGEYQCVRDAFVADAEQAGTQVDDIPSGDLVQGLMDADLLAHTFMANDDYSSLALQLAPTITLDQVNNCVKDLLEFAGRYKAEGVPFPAAVLICSPTGVRDAGALSQRVDRMLEEGIAGITRVSSRVEEHPDNRMIDELISRETVRGWLRAQRPRWVALDEGDGFDHSKGGVDGPAAAAAAAAAATVPVAVGGDRSVPKKEHSNDHGPASGGHTRLVDSTLDVVQRRLSNGLVLTMKKTSNIANHFTIRAVSTGGIMHESKSKPAAVRAGVQALIQGASAGNWTREEIDLFCMKKLLNVSITALPETTFWEIGAPESSLSSAVQMLRLFMTDVQFHPQDLENVKRIMKSRYRNAYNSLEQAPLELLSRAITSDDARYSELSPDVVDQLTVEDVKSAVFDQFRPDNLGIVAVGDFDLERMESQVFAYLGTIPSKNSASKSRSPSPSSSSLHSAASQRDSSRNKQSPSPQNIKPDFSRREQRVQLPDSKSRAIGYIAGDGPDRYGCTANNLHPFDTETGIWMGGAFGESVNRRGNSEYQNHLNVSRRAHPAYVYATIDVLEKMLNNELFLVVRDKFSLSYHVNLEIGKAGKLPSNGWIVTVHAQAEKIDRAMKVCEDVLKKFRAGMEQLEDAKRSLISKHQNSLSVNQKWLDLLCGGQSKDLPRRNLRLLRDYESVVTSLTTEDIHDVYAAFNFRSDLLFKSVAISGGSKAKSERNPNETP